MILIDFGDEEEGGRAIAPVIVIIIYPASKITTNDGLKRIRWYYTKL